MRNLLIKQLKAHEGFRPLIYTDSTGHSTIGYGTNLDVGITERQAEALLSVALDDIEIELFRRKPWINNLNEVRQAVLINMAYNLGVHGLLKFKNMWSALEAYDYHMAAHEMIDSLWSAQVGQRSGVLARMMLNGKWPEEDGIPN